MGSSMILPLAPICPPKPRHRRGSRVACEELNSSVKLIVHSNTLTYSSMCEYVEHGSKAD